MINILKKTFCALAAFCATFAVFAAEGNVAKVGNTEYATIQAAINAATDGQTVTVIADHELPFDGSVDYKKVVENLDKVGYSGPIMLEVYSAPYTSLSADEFLSTAKDRAIKIEKMGK